MRKIITVATITASAMLAGCSSQPASASVPAGCHVNVNNHPHSLHSGQLLSYPDMQVLCSHGTVFVETRTSDH
jgi:hypothetical protein